jgi:glycosyltransferase involved in cell wall biosynthesis
VIDVLLATFNGARYLPELLASLERQTERRWRLLLRDDGSTDGSPELVRAWARRSGTALLAVEDGARLGASGNFSALLALSDAPYFMPCDQDDVWLPHKMERLLGAVGDAEARRGRSSPIVAHSDLVVVDAGLSTLHPSFRRYQRLMTPAPDRPYERLALQNVVTGCAALGNAALRDLARPIPAEAMMHDWWLALVAATFGEIVPLVEPTVLYRQHGANTLGARSWSVWGGLRRFARDPAASARRARRILSGTRAQAAAFRARFGERLDPRAARFFEEYAGLGSAGLVTRKVFPFRHDLWFDDPMRNGGLLLFI